MIGKMVILGVALILAACAPGAGKPIPVTGTIFDDGQYTVVFREDNVPVCQASIHIDLSLNGDAAVTSYTWVVVSGPGQAGMPCTFASWQFNGQLECVVGCGKVFLPMPNVEQAMAVLHFTRRPDFARLEATFDAHWAGNPAGQHVDRTPEIRCDQPPSSRCVFYTPSQN